VVEPRRHDDVRVDVDDDSLRVQAVGVWSEEPGVAACDAVHLPRAPQAFENRALIGGEAEIENGERVVVSLEPQRPYEREKPDEVLRVRHREEPDGSRCIARRPAAHYSGAVGPAESRNPRVSSCSGAPNTTGLNPSRNS